MVLIHHPKASTLSDVSRILSQIESDDLLAAEQLLPMFHFVTPHATRSKSLDEHSVPAAIVLVAAAAYLGFGAIQNIADQISQLREIVDCLFPKVADATEATNK